MESSIGNLFASVTSVYNRAIATSDGSNPQPGTESNSEATEWWCLGEFYDTSRARERRERELGIMWWSYRSGFSEMKPYGFTSDTGWGCMLRCSQMLLCQSLSLHRPSITPDTYLNLFADVPGKAHPFGIHGMCRAGLGRDKFPGEWFGPREGCYVVKDLVGGSRTGEDLEVMVAGEGCIYRDKVVEEMEKVEVGGEPLPPPPPISSDHDPLYNPPPSLSSPQDWSKSLLILIPLRLGVNGIDGRYRKNIVEAFSMKSFTGMMGGTPRHAIYFYGVDKGGGGLRGKDPHTTQFAPRRGRGEGKVKATREYRDSVRGGDVTVRLESIDPSLALGFYVRGREEFEAFVREAREGVAGEDLEGGKRLFSVEDRAPDYGGDLGLEGCVMDGEEGEDKSEDEWEFI
ncbi:hypothetical protein TrRE_jg8081 [Triparma retinervis]|uniref:Cysteine protease n=1 Tax=Triparma retinervis TaxID=2557542 RepID=A0A9W6ZSG7_9STRA|nr:hypothetical protein TrRE_jg8081 [Triparma retinervis]